MDSIISTISDDRVVNVTNIDNSTLEKSKWTTVSISSRSKKFEDERQQLERLRQQPRYYSQALILDEKERLKNDFRRRTLYKLHKRSSWATKLEYYVEPIAKPEYRSKMITDVMELEPSEERSNALKKIERLIRNYFLRDFKIVQLRVLQIENQRVQTERNTEYAKHNVCFMASGKPFDEEDVCLICKDTLEEGNITWCAQRCGMNFHVECIGMWMDHQDQQRRMMDSMVADISGFRCPHCQEQWLDGAARFSKAQSGIPKSWLGRISKAQYVPPKLQVEEADGFFAERLIEERWSRFDRLYQGKLEIPKVWVVDRLEREFVSGLLEDRWSRFDRLSEGQFMIPTLPALETSSSWLGGMLVGWF